MRFKVKSHLQGEAASTEGEVTESYSEGLAKISNEGGHTEQQILSVDSTALCWKKMPCRTFIAREKSVPGFKGQADSC